MPGLERFFGVFDGELPSSVCSEIIARFEADGRKVEGMVGDSRGGGGAVDRRVKETTEILLWTNSDGWEDVNELIQRSLQRRLRTYLKPFGEAFPIGIYPEEPRITRYRIGEGFNAWHSDNIGRSPTRVITAIWYLNTVRRGGETWYKWQGQAVRPVEGRLMLCPVGWPFIHRGNAPRSEPKYILITQLHQASPRVVQAEHRPAAANAARPFAGRRPATPAPLRVASEPAARSTTGGGSPQDRIGAEASPTTDGR